MDRGGKIYYGKGVNSKSSAYLELNNANPTRSRVAIAPMTAYDWNRSIKNLQQRSQLAVDNL